MPQKKASSTYRTLVRVPPSPLLLRAAEHRREHDFSTKAGLRRAADVVVKALANSSDDEAVAAIDALEQMSLLGLVKPPTVMGAINRMRCEVCWARPTLLEHTKCVKFLAKICKEGKDGDGQCDDVCQKFKALLTKSCYDESLPTPQAWCDLHEYIWGEPPKRPDSDEDKDADGVPNKQDEFPADPSESVDTDGDGVGDNADKDSDGDGYPDSKDRFPADPNEWEDKNGNGIGDNSENKDTDGDGVPDSKDKFPNDPKEWEDKNGNGIGDNSEKELDTDGDGVPDSEDDDDDNDGHKDDVDKFPLDPKEWGDMDGDGIGDNADKDKDGDGCDNEADDYPEDPSRCKTDAGDRDGDGYGDAVDAFPDDPKEWLDSDGDGHGDNGDAYPHNANCYSSTEPCDDKVEEHFEGHYVDPSKLNKLEKGLPSQGYDEVSKRLVEHDDGKTFAGDWQGEWPENNRHSMQQSIEEICKNSPTSVWCKDRKRMAKFAR